MKETWSLLVFLTGAQHQLEAQITVYGQEHPLKTLHKLSISSFDELLQSIIVSFDYDTFNKRKDSPHTLYILTAAFHG